MLPQRMVLFHHKGLRMALLKFASFYLQLRSATARTKIAKRRDLGRYCHGILSSDSACLVLRTRFETLMVGWPRLADL